MAVIRIGTCGFGMARAEYYARFDCVELQQTFYQPPQRATAERWRQEAPEGFEFTLKAFQAITHPPDSPTYRRCRLSTAERALAGGFRDTPVVREAWRLTREIARALDARIVVFQCPASFLPTDENVANLRWFFAWIDREGIVAGWEPRGPAWSAVLIADLCRELRLLHVTDPFVRPPAFGEGRYFRLHGIGGYRYRFSDADLRRLLAWCDAPWSYCMFNNLSMTEDAARFRQLVRSAAVQSAGEVPPLPGGPSGSGGEPHA